MTRTRLAWARRVVLTLLSAALLISGLHTHQAEALSGADFQPGNIISDAVFFNSSTMNAANVQDFLNVKGAGCTAGEMPCLKDYVTSTPSTPLENGLCAAMPATTASTAAQIIARVATACGINPRVLLVTIQKESSLVTRSAPTRQNYNTATGFACPDTAPCDAQYYGLFNQVYRMARQFKVYTANPTRYGYQKGRYNTILFNPNTACGSSPVYIQNQATANLYIYTPYQPNAAALANLYGSGDACSTYGNRNFWRIFSDWFGSPTTGSPSGAALLYRNDNSSGIASGVRESSVRGQRYLTCDWNGDGVATVGAFSGGRWDLSERNGAVTTLGFGDAGDVPVCGRWSAGSTAETVGIYRPSTRTFHLRNANSTGIADSRITIGDPGDRPIIGDWNGDGLDTVGLYRPANSHFYLAAGNTGAPPVSAFHYGNTGDSPVVGRWSGGPTSIGVRRGITFHLATTPGGPAAYRFDYGSPTDTAVFGDWDANGTETIAVIRLLGT